MDSTRTTSGYDTVSIAATLLASADENYLALQEAVLKQQCNEETAVLQINAELARQCVLLCSMLHNEQ